MIVLDASVLLATLLNEPGGEVFPNITDDFAISAVNLGEVVHKLVERGYSGEAILAALEPFRGNCPALTAAHAIQAGLWRNVTKRFGLSMGDRCCLALGLELGAEVYTADRAWAGLDLGVKVRVIR